MNAQISVALFGLIILISGVVLVITNIRFIRSGERVSGLVTRSESDSIGDESYFFPTVQFEWEGRTICRRSLFGTGRERYLVKREATVLVLKEPRPRVRIESEARGMYSIGWVFAIAGMLLVAFHQWIPIR